MLTVSLADYGVGNLHSLRKALENCGAKVVTVTDMRDLLDAECIAFPGVGAFDRTMERLAPYRDGIRARLEDGIPALSICIGTQILLDRSEEGSSPGIGLIEGDVRRIPLENVPHMGWNTVEGDDPMFEDVPDRHFYFANSYHCDPVDRGCVVGTTEYCGYRFPTLIRKGNLVGSQFHPEKSSASGMAFLRNFIRFAENTA